MNFFHEKNLSKMYNFIGFLKSGTQTNFFRPIHRAVDSITRALSNICRGSDLTNNLQYFECLIVCVCSIFACLTALTLMAIQLNICNGIPSKYSLLLLVWKPLMSRLIPFMNLSLISFHFRHSDGSFLHFSSVMSALLL